MQISSNWNPFDSAKNLKIGVVDLDNSLSSKAALKGIIKTDNDLKFNGSDQKYNLNVNKIYLKNQDQVNQTLSSGGYDAIYVIPKDYQKNQINTSSNLILNEINTLNEEMNKPNFLQNNKQLEKIIFTGLNNFINIMHKKKLDKKIPWKISKSENILFTLLDVFIRNSRINHKTLNDYNKLGITYHQLSMIDKNIVNIINKTPSWPKGADTPFSTLGFLMGYFASHLKDLPPTNTYFWKHMGYNDFIFPLINGLLSSFLSSDIVNNIHHSPSNTDPKINSNKGINLYLSTQNSALSSELIHMLTNSPKLINNIYNNVLTRLSTEITNKIRLPIQSLVKDVLSDTTNFLEHTILKHLYPTLGFLIMPIVTPILKPLSDPTFLWPSLNKSLETILSDNITHFNFNISGLIHYKAIGNPNRTLGQIIAPNLMVLAMWLSLLGFVFIARNKRAKGNENNSTLKHYISKLWLYISISLLQMLFMLTPMIIYGLTSGSMSWYLLIYGFLIEIILALIAEAISFLSKSEISVILVIFLLLAMLTIAYGIFPLELESGWYRWINYLSPTKYVIDGFNNLFTNQGITKIILSILPLFAFLLIIPIALFINIRFDNNSLKKYGKYKDFANEIDEEE